MLTKHTAVLFSKTSIRRFGLCRSRLEFDKLRGVVCCACLSGRSHLSIGERSVGGGEAGGVERARKEEIGGRTAGSM